jgi:hypothetical protein
MRSNPLDWIGTPEEEAQVFYQNAAYPRRVAKERILQKRARFERYKNDRKMPCGRLSGQWEIMACRRGIKS